MMTSNEATEAYTSLVYETSK
jgi:hypothetical protein